MHEIRMRYAWDTQDTHKYAILDTQDTHQIRSDKRQIRSDTHEIALIPKGIKAGDLRRGCEGLDIWNSWGNYCAAPKSVGSQTMNEDSSRSQHGELTASRTGGTDQLNAHSELRIQILVRANSAEKVPDT